LVRSSVGGVFADLRLFFRDDDDSLPPDELVMPIPPFGHTPAR
jgi:hypothetical protein